MINVVTGTAACFLIGFLIFECRMINVVTGTAADMILDISNTIKEGTMFCYVENTNG